MLAFFTNAVGLHTHLAVPFHLVSIALEVGNADAEVVQLIGELSLQLGNESLVGSADVAIVRLGHSLRDHLRHLITRDVLVALERRVAIALDNAILCELCNSIISPMASRYIGERISSSERRAGCAHDQSGRQSGYESLFHKETPPLYRYK